MCEKCINSVQEVCEKCAKSVQEVCEKCVKSVQEMCEKCVRSAQEECDKYVKSVRNVYTKALRTQHMHFVHQYTTIKVLSASFIRTTASTNTTDNWDPYFEFMWIQ